MVLYENQSLHVLQWKVTSSSVPDQHYDWFVGRSLSCHHLFSLILSTIVFIPFCATTSLTKLVATCLASLWSPLVHPHNSLQAGWAPMTTPCNEAPFCQIHPSKSHLSVTQWFQSAAELRRDLQRPGVSARRQLARWVGRMEATANLCRLIASQWFFPANGSQHGTGPGESGYRLLVINMRRSVGLSGAAHSHWGSHIKRLECFLRYSPSTTVRVTNSSLSLLAHNLRQVSLYPHTPVSTLNTPQLFSPDWPWCPQLSFTHI